VISNHEKATRRTVLRCAAGLALASVLTRAGKSAEPKPAILMRSIPTSGELVPVVGMGTGINFGQDDDLARREAIAHVVETLVEGGGSVVDTASSYGPAETVIGSILAKAQLRPRIFLATKLEDEELPPPELSQGSVGATVTGSVNSHADVQGSFAAIAYQCHRPDAGA
jgi:aryl-alcohol dehydrogenase-like predicted oxidoreductase